MYIIIIHTVYHHNTSLDHSVIDYKTFQWFFPPRTEPASFEKNPVTPASGPPGWSGSSGTEALYALRNSSLTSFNLRALVA